MTEQDLQFSLAEGEGQFIEFKERPDKSLAREMVAFANASGGRIFIGVKDDASVSGIQIDNRLKSQIQDIARNCDPSIPIRLQSQGSIFIIEVPESENKPHSCSDGFFIRLGANSQKLGRDEIFEMGIRSGKLRFDEQLCTNFNISSDLDMEKLASYLKHSGLNTGLPTGEVLANLEVLRIENGHPRLTHAGVLFFAKDPARFIKSASVVCAVYQGDDKVQILDRKIFNDGLVGNIDAAVMYVKRHMDVRFEIRSIRREEIPQYPEAAFREAIVNAVMHRDYFDISGDIMVEIFKNRLVVSNPGGLVAWLPPEDFGKYSRTRNRLIASLLMRTEQAEKMGTGIRRIQQALKTAGQPPAEFDYDDYNFSITLFSALHAGQAGTLNVPLNVPLNVSLNEKIICLVRENPGVKRKELAALLDVADKTAGRYLSELIATQRVEHRGSKKTGGYWVVKP